MNPVEIGLAALRHTNPQAGSMRGEQTDRNLSFLNLLASLEAMTTLTPLMGEGKEELLNDNENEWKEKLESILDILGQVISPVASPAQALELNQLKDQFASLIMKDREQSNKDSLLLFSKISSMIVDLRDSGVDLPVDLQKMLKELTQNIENPQVENEVMVTSNGSVGEENIPFEIRPSQPFPSLTFVRQPGSLHSIPATPMVGHTVHQDSFLPEMTEFMMSRIRITSSAGTTDAKLTLYPEHMGQLDIKLSLNQGQLTAQFIAETALGKDLLESNLAALRTALQQQGVQVDKIDIFDASEASLLNQHQQPRDQSGAFKQNPSKQSLSASSEPGSRDEAVISYETNVTYGQPLGSMNKKIDFTA